MPSAPTTTSASIVSPPLCRSRTERRPSRSAAEARDKILVATEELLSEGGFQAVTMGQWQRGPGSPRPRSPVVAQPASVPLDFVSARMTPIMETSKAAGYRQRFKRQLKANIHLLNSAQGHAI
jgi:hypothetical protein